MVVFHDEVSAHEFEKKYYKTYEHVDGYANLGGKINSNKVLYHYTSLAVLYNLLSNDTFWAANTRFSNDSSEERLLGKYWIDETKYHDDNYIICFCNHGDQLSQWRGYCPDGGVSIGLHLPEVKPFSVLHADFDKSGLSEEYYNAPYPVFYANDESTPGFAYASSTTDDRSMVSYKLVFMKSEFIDIMDAVPYLKNNKFNEEKEFRQVFVNRNGAMSKCVRYREIKNGTKVPYMAVMPGLIGDNKTGCSFTANEVERKLDEIKEKQVLFATLEIPQGSNQESVFHMTKTMVDEYNEKATQDYDKVRVVCAGHLPVMEIIVSPMPGNKRIEEQIRHFCKNKYWLRDVKVSCSEIPYIASAK